VFRESLYVVLMFTSRLTVYTSYVWLLHVVSDSSSTPLARMEQFSVFESVQEITGALVVERHSRNFTNLSFLRNLRIVHGRQLEWVEQSYCESSISE